MALALQRLPLKVATFAIVFVAVLLSVRALEGSSPSTQTFSGEAAQLAPDASTDEQIAALRSDVAADPFDADLRTQLGLAYLTKAGEVADPSFYLKSKAALDGALRRDPANFNATSAMGKLALARHQFRDALRYGEQARRINPTIAANYGILTDAHVELGQYGAAERTLQRWVNLKPGLAPYARVSYFRELHGDLAGALAAMKLAVDAAGSKDFTYVQSLVAKLELDRGNYAAAASAYRSALAVDPAYPAALAGLGAVEAAQGRTGMALRHYRAAARAIPVADYPLAIGELHEAAGHDAAAHRAYDRAGALIRREIPNGVDVRAELALFEAEYGGDPAQAVRLARASLPVRPSVTGADSLAWALHKAGRPMAALEASMHAMRLGSRDPGLLYRAGMIALAAGREARGERLLGTLLEQSPHFSPLFAPEARQALSELRQR